MMNPIVWLIDALFGVASFMLFIYIILSLLITFQIVSTRNTFVMQLNQFLRQVFDPILDKIRKYIKPFNGIDLSPLVLILGIGFARQTFLYIVFMF